MKLALMLTLLSISIASSAIGYFRIKFIADAGGGNKTTYYGLLLYYDDNSDLNTMRVYYQNAFGEKILVEEKIKIEYNKSLGNEYRILRGYNPNVLEDSKTYPEQYFSDIFVFKKDESGFYKPYYTESIIEDLGKVKGNIIYFKAVEGISEKELKRFGFGRSYNKNNLIMPDSKMGADEAIPIVLSHQKGFIKVQVDLPQSTSRNTVAVSDEIGTVHLIIISNTEDDELGNSCKKNETGIERLLGSVILQSGSRSNILKISGTDFKLKVIDDKINALTIAENDGILLYYSGHGFRTSDEPDSFPYLDLRANSLIEQLDGSNTKNLQAIYDSLKIKKPRFCIVIGECCNNNIGITTSEVLPNNKSQSLKTATPSRQTINPELAKKLISFKGAILVATASPNQKSYYYPDDGGVFWNQFRDIMSFNLLGLIDSNTDWIEFIKYSADKTSISVKGFDSSFIQIPLWVQAGL